MVFLNSSLYFLGLLLLDIVCHPFSIFYLSFILSHLSTFLVYIHSNYAVCKISEETDEVMKDETEAKNGQSNKIWIIVLTAVILLAGAGTGAIFYIRKKKQLNRFFED